VLTPVLAKHSKSFSLIDCISHRGVPEGVSSGRRKRSGALVQQLLQVAENLRFYGRINGLPASWLRKRTDYVVELNGLAPYLHRLAAQLSGGWKQRLALACACYTNQSSCSSTNPLPVSTLSRGGSFGISCLSFRNWPCRCLVWDLEMSRESGKRQRTPAAKTKG